MSSFENIDKSNDSGGVRSFIQSDLTRYYGRNGVFLFIKAYLRNRTFRWQVAFRMCKGKGLIRVIGEALWFFNRNKRIIQIPKNTLIGYGLYIGHNGPVIVNNTAVIGNNVNLSQFTTIGSHTSAARIGDNVYIGPGVSIVGPVNIGNNVTIGAGSIVTKDIPDNATAVGNYAKVINYNNPGRFIKWRW